MQKIYNKDETLTRYGFDCGYFEIYINKHKWEDRLLISANPSGFYVRGFINRTYLSESFASVKKARKFARQAGKLKYGYSLRR